MILKQIVVFIALISSPILAFSATVPAKAVTLNQDTKHIKLFILAGQSNMVGYRSNIADLPASLQQPQNNVLFYDKNDKWNKLQAPTEPFPFSGGVANKVGFGPEISLGRRIANYLKETVALVKYAANGTSLAHDWNPDVPGSDYYSMRNRVNNSIADLSSQGYAVDIAGFFFFQGESDAKSDINAAKNYGQNLTNFIDQVRTDFNEPNLPFIIGLIPVKNNQKTQGFGTFLYGDIVREAQLNVSNTVPFTGAVETIDLPGYPDNLHLSSQGLIDLGDRYGDQWIKVKSVPEPLNFLGLLGFGALIVPRLRTQRLKVSSKQLAK